jgi:hypothetical protein
MHSCILCTKFLSPLSELIKYLQIESKTSNRELLVEVKSLLIVFQKAIVTVAPAPMGVLYGKM